MYYAIVALTMFALPALSIVVDTSSVSSFLDPQLVGRWFVFWAVGVRLVMAGLRQIIQPKYTASVVLGLQGEESLLLVRELGFANVAIGLVGLLSIAMPSWRDAGALAGGVFYGLAGANHIFQPHRNRLENVAMFSDLIVAAVLLWSFVAALNG